MEQFALLICRSQTEASDLRRQLARLGVPGEVTRPPRRADTDSCGWAVRVAAAQAQNALHELRQHGIVPRRVEYEGDSRDLS